MTFFSEHVERLCVFLVEGSGGGQCIELSNDSLVSNKVNGVTLLIFYTMITSSSRIV